MPPTSVPRHGIPGMLCSALVLRSGVVLAHYIPPSPASQNLSSSSSSEAVGDAGSPFGTRATVGPGGDARQLDETAPLIQPKSVSQYGAAAAAAGATTTSKGSSGGITPAQLPTLLREMGVKLGEAPLGKISVSPRQVVHFLYDGDRGQLVVAILCSIDYSPRLALETLKCCHNRLIALPGIATAPVGELHRSVLSILGESIAHIETTLGGDAMTTAKGDLDEVKEVMLHNIEQVLARGERLEDLVQRTEGITNQSVRFFVRSRDAARRAAWKQYKFIAISVFTVMVLLLSASWITCGFPGFQYCLPHF